MDFGTQGPQAPADLAWLRGVDAYTMGAYPVSYTHLTLPTILLV